MPEQNVEAYLSRMAEIRATGAATGETSYYGALETLLNAVGRTLKPRVVANGQLRNQGAGMPDFGLYTQSQCRGGAPREGQSLTPERGVVEVKAPIEPVLAVADTDQVSRYWRRYQLVLVANYREFLLIGVDERGAPVRLEGFAIADSDAAFWEACAHPRRTARVKGATFVEYLRRALAHLAPLTRPADLAWLLASYARDALARVEGASLPALDAVRTGLEQALGLKFEGERGEHFFRSTLVQTLFYGVFSAWVQWYREQPAGAPGRFDWHLAEWTLHVPMVRSLYELVASPSQLRPLGLVEVLDWTGAALNRVDRVAFFDQFDAGLAVQHFYEPFLAAFDPEIRKQLGVWYTPPEVVRYMVARVDAVLEQEMGIKDGLAASNVYVLDPCCGTGSFLVETLRRIAERLGAQGDDALAGEDLKQAAMERVFGFEIMPAPFVIAHWQIGLLLSASGARFNGNTDERAAVYLTNALTGWQPPEGPRQPLLFRELEAERDAAERVKREVPILVILGNPPYNAYAGVSPAEEEGLVEPYKRGLHDEWGIRKFNLDDLYVRFFRIAERRIAEMTGRGIVAYISNYSWTSEKSFVVMRRSIFRNFDRIWIENMHGNRVISEYAPDGRTSETIFATAGFSPGIQQGVTVALLARIDGRGPCIVRYRDDLNQAKAHKRRQALLDSLDDSNAEQHYQLASPSPANRFSLRPQAVRPDYPTWPRLVDLAAVEPFSGVLEMRKGSLIAIDRNVLEARMRQYLDPSISNGTLRVTGVGPVENAGRFDAERARSELLRQEDFDPARVRRYAMYPLDLRWCYHTNVRPIWNEPRPAFAEQARDGNRFIVTRMAARRPGEGLPIIVTRALANYHLLDPNTHAFPVRLLNSSSSRQDLFDDGEGSRANLSPAARAWLQAIGWPDPDADPDAGAAPWLHALAICCAPAWLAENRDAILADWPRMALPGSAETLRGSAALGSRLAALLDPDEPVPGVTTGTIEPPFAAFGAIARAGGGQLASGDLAITVGWGHGGGGRPVMPGQGRLSERDAYAQDELGQIEAAARAHGETAHDLLARLGPPVDIWLNDAAYWRTVPHAVWEFRIGGYQVVKKWLSYREADILGRPLTPVEAREVTAIGRRLAALVLMQPELDANYRAVRGDAYPWPS